MTAWRQQRGWGGGLATRLYQTTQPRARRAAQTPVGGETQARDEHVVLARVGSAAGPAGSGAGSVGSGAAPLGSGAGPDGSGAAPDGSGAAPLGSGAAPLGSGAAPLGSDAAPLGSDAAPLGSDAAPLGSDAAPLGSGAGRARSTASVSSLGDRPAGQGGESSARRPAAQARDAQATQAPDERAAQARVGLVGFLHSLGGRSAGQGGESPTRRPDADRPRKRRPGVTARRLLALALFAGMVAGCGIRSTEVPTDFGPAPSRVRCSLSESGAARASGGLAVQVFLLCGSSLVAVDRTVRVPDGTEDSERRVLVAQGLLDQLAEAPSAAEQDAGYQTYVRGGTTVSGPRPKDPEDTLRLSTPPAGLSRYALAQLVCTFSDSAAAEGNGSVILGGPGTAPLRRYDCTDQVRSQPSSHQPPSSEVTGG